MKKFFVAIGVASLVAGLLTACAPTSSIVADTVITIGQDAPASSLNPGALADEAVADSNAYITGLTQSAFFEIDSAGELVANDLFGYEKLISSTAENFQASYTVRKNITWSDGAAIDGTDLLLSWAAAKNLGDAGFISNLSNTGLAAAGSPKLGVSNRRLYLTFDHPVADWQYAAVLTVPAHLVAAQAFGEQTDVASAKQKVADAILKNDLDALKKIAEVFNGSYNLSSAAFDVTKVATSGAYSFESASNSAVVLKARADCAWCKKAKVETVNLKFFGTSAELMDAINNSEVDLAEAIDSATLPLATLVANLEKLSSQGYQYSTLQSGKIEALVLNYNGQSLFGPNQKLVKPEAAEKLRQALLLLLPRQRIVDSLGVPIKLTRSDSFAFLSTQSQYSAATQQNGSAEYRIQNAEKAAEILKGLNLGGRGTVRILFATSDLNAQIMFNLLNQYASDSNLRLANGSTDDVSAALLAGSFEAYFTRLNSLSVTDTALGAIQSASTSAAMPAVAEQIAKLAANPAGTDSNEILAQIDNELFKAGYGLPLFELPKVVVFSSKLKNYASPGGASSAVSNFDRWTVSPEKQQ